MPSLVQRTADQQHRKLVAAESRNRIRLANLVLEQRCDFPQQIVPDHMAEAVVDGLESIEIEITDDVTGVLAAR